MPRWFDGFRRVSTASTTAVSCMLGLVAVAGAQDYSISEIPTFGGASSVATDVNNFGIVCGYAKNSSGQDRALMWSSGVSTALSTLGGANCRAQAINDNGRIAGEAETSGGVLRAVRWQPEFILDIGDLGGGSAAAFDINNNDVMTGWSTVSTGGNRRAFRWSLGAGMIALSPLGQPGGFLSEAYGINSNNNAVGKGDIGFPTFAMRAALWPFGSAMTTIASQNLSVAYATNTQGQIVGSAPGVGAFVWASGSMSALLGGVTGEALDINSAGSIVGYVVTAGVTRAVLWESGGFLDLNQRLPAGSGWMLERANAINEIGQIVGTGTLNGTPRGFVLSRLGLEVVDPVPGLLAGADVSSDPQLLSLAPGRPVFGCATDGVTRVLFRVRGLPGPGQVNFTITDEAGQSQFIGKLRSPGGSQDVTSLTVPVSTLTSGEQIAFAVLIAPEDFARGPSDVSLVFRPVNLHVEYFPSGGGSTITTSQQLQLRRPPIMLLHGLFSDNGTWQWPLQTDTRFIVYSHDYRERAGDYFQDNVFVARQGIASARLRYQALGFAATQVDAVGHSMGGILSRLYISGYGGIQYHRNDNFGAGDVNRLITVDTPHIGSPIANAIVEVRDNPILAAIGLAAHAAIIYGYCVDCGAIDDLQTSSPITQNFPVTPIPCHAIVGKGGSDLVSLGLDAFLDVTPLTAFVRTLLKDAGLPYSTVMPPSVQHDAVVTRPSQEGQIATVAGHVSIFSYNPSPPPPYAPSLALHGTMPKDALVSDRVAVLLDENVGDTSVFASAFPTGPGGVAGSGGFTLPSYGSLVSGLQITSPTAGSQVVPGQQVTFTAAPTSGFVPHHVLFVWPQGVAYDDTSPFSVTIPVPLNAIGSMTLYAHAFDAAWNIAEAPTISINVFVAAQLTGLVLQPQPIYLFNFSPTDQAHVLGQYADGVLRDITSPTFGTIYSTANPSIATVNTTGEVSAVAAGYTTLTVSNGSQSAVVDVFVNSIPCMGDFNEDNVVNGIDLGILLGSWGPCPGCVADMDGNNQVNGIDLGILLGNWGPC